MCMIKNKYIFQLETDMVRCKLHIELSFYDKVYLYLEFKWYDLI